VRRAGRRPHALRLRYGRRCLEGPRDATTGCIRGHRSPQTLKLIVP
jgi:hypothetical protein